MKKLNSTIDGKRTSEVQKKLVFKPMAEPSPDIGVTGTTAEACYRIEVTVGRDVHGVPHSRPVAAHGRKHIGVVGGSHTSYLQVDTNQIMQMMLLALTNCALSVPKEPRNMLNIQLQKVDTDCPCDAEYDLSASTKCAEQVERGRPHMNVET